jgi:hypothetical protein
MKESRKSLKSKRLSGRAVFGAFTLCGFCCALPILGGVLGIGSAVAVAVWLEWAAIGLLALAIVDLQGLDLMRQLRQVALDSHHTASRSALK